MQILDIIGKYTVTSEPQILSEHLHFYKNCEDAGNDFDILVLQETTDNKRKLNRQIENEIKPLIGCDVLGFVKTIDVGYNAERSFYYIVYEHFSDDYLKDFPNNIDIPVITNIAKGLDNFKKNGNNQGFIISPKFILVNEENEAKILFPKLYDFFLHEKILDDDYLSPQAIKHNKGDSQLSPNHQDDMFSLVKTFEAFLQDNYSDVEREKPVLDELIKKTLDPDRKKRFSKYYELIELLQKLTPIKRLQLPSLAVITQPEYEDDIDEVISSMNENTWMVVDPELSERGQVTGRFTTNEWTGRFFVDDDGYLFIPYTKCRNNCNNAIIQDEDAFLLDAQVEYDANTSEHWIDFFGKKFQTRNQLAILSRKKQNELEVWQKLPETEKKFIEMRAFKIPYKKVEEGKDGSKLLFYLDGEQENAPKISWGKIRNMKNEKKILFVGDQIVGKIGDWRSDSKVITIQDPFCTFQEIPSQGILSEDIRQETSQYKKQVEACQKFIKSSVANKELGDIIATPEASIECNVHDLDYDGFKDKLFNSNIAKDDSQLEAVLEAINYKPIYIIQGPPGTGKTTVIVETIRQIVNEKPNAKILLTSQSNLAVDNVLEKLVGETEIRFIRLASDNALENDNVSESMKPHCYEEKLKSWVGETEQKSKKYMEENVPSQEGNRNLYEIFKAFEDAQNKNDIKLFKKALAKGNDYLKQLFENAEDFTAVEAVLKETFGEKYFNFKLKKIQKDWIAFIGNSSVNYDSDRKVSMLNNGSEEINFLTAMLLKMNILGATCIHIASSRYSRVNFNFDYVIMDESSKATPAESLVPISMGRNIILIGDDKQLPPVITRDDAVKQDIKEQVEDDGLDIEKTYGVSLFEKIKKEFESSNNKRYVKMLDIQYRMPKQIGSLISKYFYDGKLKNPDIEGYDEKKSHKLSLKKETSIVFLNTSNRENHYDNGDKFNRQNQCNVDTIKELLSKLNSLYPHNASSDNPFDIGVIAGYRGQVELLKKQVDAKAYGNFIKDNEPLVQINTVDKFQGAERDIIIYDIVRSSHGHDNIGFLADYRRINVAFSRAKRLLFIIGDSDYLLNRAVFTKSENFTEFKLKQIVEELQKEGLVFNSMEKIFNE